jgi:ribonuclease-3
MPEFEEFEKLIGVEFKDRSLLKLALVHTSYVNENPELAPESNERLEFLGDAVLGLAVAHKLYQALPGISEGEMTRLRAAVIRRDTLARIAESIQLGRFLYLGKGEETGGGRGKTLNLASGLEAVMGSVFLDRDFEVARDFILRLLERELHHLTTSGARLDFKTELQETVQARHQQTPLYYLIESSGPPHDRTFVVEVRVGDETLGRGVGKTKKAAETDAAHNALDKLAERFTA